MRSLCELKGSLRVLVVAECCDTRPLKVLKSYRPIVLSSYCLNAPSTAGPILLYIGVKIFSCIVVVATNNFSIFASALVLKGHAPRRD